MSEKSNTILGCKEAVAFEMMKLLSANDHQNINRKIEDPKGYVFGLYLECLSVISGNAPCEK